MWVEDFFVAPFVFVAFKVKVTEDRTAFCTVFGIMRFMTRNDEKEHEAFDPGRRKKKKKRSRSYPWEEIL
jgi:hypothetical protein